MRKTVYAIIACVLAAGCATGTKEVNRLSKFEPEDGKCLVFIGQDMEAIGGVEGKNGYVDSFGTPAGITIYTNIRPGDVSYGYTYQGLDGLTSNANWGAGNCFADRQLSSPLLKDCDVAIGLELVNHEEKVASGEHDSYIRRLGQWIDSIAPRRVFLRIGYEFDGHAWNHYDSTAYVSAFRRIHDMLDSMQVNNVAYVWQSAGTNNNISELYAYYPGDEYVDWFAYSQFASGRCQTMIDLARKHHKPLFIAESTPMFREEGKSVIELRLSNAEQASRAWDTWYEELFSTIESNPDVVKAFSYINADWPSERMWQGDTVVFSQIDARLQVSKEVSAKWREKMNLEKYIHHPVEKK